MSTRLLIQTGSKTQVARDWTVVNIPEEDVRRTVTSCVADAVALFGVYIKFMIVLAEDEAAVHIPSEDSRRNATHSSVGEEQSRVVKGCRG